MIQDLNKNQILFIFLFAIVPCLVVSIFILLLKDVLYVKDSIDVFIESHQSVDLQKELLQAKGEEAQLKAELAQLKGELTKEIKNLKANLEYSQTCQHFLVVGLTCIVGGLIIYVVYTL